VLTRVTNTLMTPTAAAVAATAAALSFCLTSYYTFPKITTGFAGLLKGECLRLAEAGFFTGQLLSLSPNQQCQSTGGALTQ